MCDNQRIRDLFPKPYSISIKKYYSLYDMEVRNGGLGIFSGGETSLSGRKVKFMNWFILQIK